jgi:transcriptional regulator with XRE-family HTH domain
MFSLLLVLGWGLLFANSFAVSIPLAKSFAKSIIGSNKGRRIRLPRTKQRGVPSLGEQIKRLMEALQLDVSELSARTGISVSYLSRIIRGEVANPTIDFVTRIAAGLGVTETQLLRPALRRRHSGALGAAPLPPTLGQRIDAILEEENLPSEDRERIATLLIPHTKELARFIKLVSGERNEAEN